MKSIIAIISLISMPCFALSLTIKAPCDNSELIYEPAFAEGLSVGNVTVQTLDKHNVPYIGSAAAINSLLGTPVGLEAMDVVSDTEMYAYGWCYTVNGFGPEEYPDQVLIEKDDQVLWYFGSAHFKDGLWLTQCEPSSSRRFESYCNLQ